jgi:tryptophan 2,3-dioxygenase
MLHIELITSKKKKTMEKTDADWLSNQSKCPFLSGQHTPRLTTEQTEGVNYDTYIGVKTLRTLFKPVSPFHGEVIFGVVHQTIELWFRLVIAEIKQVTDAPQATINDKAKWLKMAQQVTALAVQINNSMNILKTNLTTSEFFEFRAYLQPASGFQSAQFREIEFMVTALDNLLHAESCYLANTEHLKQQFENLYWFKASVHAQTLSDFLKSDGKNLYQTALDYRHKNLAYLFENVISDALRTDKEVIQALDRMQNALLFGFKKAHLQLAKFHLAAVSTGTSGSVWRDYLTQPICYFPFLEHSFATV